MDTMSTQWFHLFSNTVTYIVDNALAINYTVFQIFVQIQNHSILSMFVTSRFHVYVFVALVSVDVLVASVSLHRLFNIINKTTNIIITILIVLYIVIWFDLGILTIFVDNVVDWILDLQITFVDFLISLQPSHQDSLRYPHYIGIV